MAPSWSGQTAYWSFYNIGKPVKGETIFSESLMRSITAPD
jgi:hypothetical protein